MSDTGSAGPAFPSHGSMGEVVQEGMTIRDYFAAAALKGLVSQPTRSSFESDTAIEAFKLADAMLKARTQ